MATGFGCSPPASSGAGTPTLALDEAYMSFFGPLGAAWGRRHGRPLERQSPLAETVLPVRRGGESPALDLPDLAVAVIDD
jgi:hypothetical protein